MTKFSDFHKKMSNLRDRQKIGLVLVGIVIVYQVVCFIQGAITARAMNYYCDKEAGTYYLQIQEDEYNKNCLLPTENSQPKSCLQMPESKRQWIEVKGSVKRPRGILFFRAPPKDRKSPDYIPDDIGGLIKYTDYTRNLNKKLIKVNTTLSVNSELFLGDYIGYYLFRKPNIKGFKSEMCR